MKAKLMTKLALAAAIACAAVGGARAAGNNLTWKISDVSASPNGSLTGANQYQAYLFFSSYENSSSSSSSHTTASLSDIYNILAGDSSSVFESLSSKCVASSKNWGNSYDTSSGTAYWRNEASTPNKGTFTAFSVIVDSYQSGSAAASPLYYMVAKVDGTGSESISKTSASSYTLDWGSQSGNTWVAIGTIPEPTSGVLLLVGVAALALRRKKAA